MEMIEGKSGKQYTPLDKNKIFYENLQLISLEKERESRARRSITATVKWLAQEFSMEKDDVLEWVSLKMKEMNDGKKNKEAAVELDRELKHNREVYGQSSELEERIEKMGAMSLTEAEEKGYVDSENEDIDE